MSQKEKLTNAKEEARKLRKKVKRVEESRNQIKTKNREKGEIIKMYLDRQQELKDNRNNWKTKCKQQEASNDELSKKLKNLASQLKMTEEELQQIRDEFNEVKKKSHKGFGKAL